VKAIRNDQMIAESDETIVVEGNHYFPANSLAVEYFEASDATPACPSSPPR